MKVLCIDTTVIAGSVALSDGGRAVAQEQLATGATHSERLIGSIDRLLSLAGWRRGDLEGIAVAIGPGSFTGLRIGLAAAKGMALSLGVPIAGVSSLLSLARNCAGFAGAVVPLIDAKRGEIFWAAWRVGADGEAIALAKESVAPPPAVAEALGSIKGDLMLVGDGALCYEQLLRDRLGPRAHLACGPIACAQAGNLAFLAGARLKEGGDDLAALAPEYVRRSDAEIGFMARHKPGKKPIKIK